MFITYNRKKELLDAIESCIRNRMDEMEIVIVDNHSSDGTQREVEALLEKKNMSYKYYYAERNLGISEGRNIAFSLCRGEYVFCLDDDAVVETEGFFSIIYQKMKECDDAVAAAVEIYEPPNDRYLKGYTYCKGGEKYALSYIGAAHVLKRESFKDRKLYPSKIRFGSEENYVAYRIRAMGKKMLYLDMVRVCHIPSDVARVYGEERKINIIVNNYIIRSLCFPKISLPVLYIFFRNRLWRHRILKNRHYSEIKKLIDERYDKEEVDRMSISRFVRMVFEVGISHVF